jgi:hypothetical protein
LAFDNPWSDIAPITVKNLLEHTAGLDNIRMWQFLNSTPTVNTPLLDAFPSTHSKLLSVRTQPGKQYSYSNMGYTLLALVIEAVRTEPYEHYLEAHLLKSLNMPDSTFEFVSQEGEGADPGLAMGYFEDQVSQSALPMYLRPAGQFTTTAPDMAKFMGLLFSDGVLNGEPFIRPDLMSMLGYPNQTDAYKAGLRIGHGLAFAARDRHEVLGMCHPGTTIGFRAYICLYPEEGKGFFYAINTDSETANYERFNALFINYLGIEKAPVATADNHIMDLSMLSGVYLPSPNNMAEFELLDLLFNFQWLSLNDDRLILKSLQRSDRILIPLTENLLRANDRTQASHVVFTDEAGNRFISDGLNTYKKHSIGIIISYWVSLLAGLLGLIYIALTASLRLMTKNTIGSGVLLWPLLNILLFSVPILLFLNQSFIKFGELSPASFSLALVSGLLPMTLLFSLFMCLKKKPKNRWVGCDCVALLMSIQLCAMLLYWDVIPIVFWR